MPPEKPSRNRTTKLNGQVRDTLSGIDLIRTHDGARGALIDAARAATATVGMRAVVGVNVDVHDELAEQRP